MTRVIKIGTTFLILGTAIKAHAAYVDPSSTSTLLQILAPLFVVFSLLSGYIKKMILRLFGKGK